LRKEILRLDRLFGANSGPGELAEARGPVGDDRDSRIDRLPAVEAWGVPKIRALVEATYFAGLRQAGVSGEIRSGHR
jgi:hypothetical protein